MIPRKIVPKENLKDYLKELIRICKKGSGVDPSLIPPPQQPRSISRPIPQGWEYLGSTGVTSCVRCIHSITNPDGTTNFCTHVCRIDEIKNHKSHCHFQRSTFIIKDEAETISKFYFKSVMFIVKKSLPISIFNDPSFIDFSNEMLQCAFMQSGIQPSCNNLTALIPNLRPDTIHKVILDLASASKTIACGSFQNSQYIHIMLDGSTIIRKKITDYFLQNEKCMPYLFSTVYDHTDDAEQQKKDILELINELLDVGINVSTITGDNKPSQVKALDHKKNSSFIKCSDKANIKSIRFIPCSCHILALVIKSMEKDEIFTQLLNLLDAQMAILTSQNFKELLGCSVPNYVSTRWLSKINAISWILKHQALIETIIKDQIDQFDKESIQQLNTCFAPESFIKIKIFASLIYPFHRLTQFLESDSTTVGDIYPSFQMLDKFLEDLESNEVFSELKGAIARARKNLSIRIKKIMMKIC